MPGSNEGSLNYVERTSSSLRITRPDCNGPKYRISKLGKGLTKSLLHGVDTQRLERFADRECYMGYLLYLLACFTSFALLALRLPITQGRTLDSFLRFKGTFLVTTYKTDPKTDLNTYISAKALRPNNGY